MHGNNPQFSYIIKDLKGPSPRVNSFYYRMKLYTWVIICANPNLKQDGLYLLYTSVKHIKSHTSKMRSLFPRCFVCHTKRFHSLKVQTCPIYWTQGMEHHQRTALGNALPPPAVQTALGTDISAQDNQVPSYLTSKQRRRHSPSLTVLI